VDYLDGTLVFQALEDNEDPWAMTSRGFQGNAEEFKLMTPEEAGTFCGNTGPLSPVHIIESGPVRTVVETLLKFNRSALIIRTGIPAKGSEVGLYARVFWNEPSRMLKLVLPTPFKKGTALAQAVLGTEPVVSGPDEHIMQQWAGVWSEKHRHALTVINESTYGFDFSNGVMRISMLRSPAFSCIPEPSSGRTVPKDRYEPRVDQGLRHFRFWLKGGDANERLQAIDREALLKNEAVQILPLFPSGDGRKPGCTIRLSNQDLRMTAMKISEQGNHLIIRLFEPVGQRAKTEVKIPPLETAFMTELQPFEIKTLAVNLKTGAVTEMDLMEDQWAEKR
jgi:alpha-mannosidase